LAQHSRYDDVATERSVIHLFVAKRMSALMPFTLGSIQCMETCFMRPAIHVWCKKFAHCRKSIDEQRPAHAPSNQQPASFFSSGIDKLVDNWDK